MTEQFIPTLTHATERDIDLLMVEELYASPTFVSWLAGRAGITGRVLKSRVLHSKRRTRNRREIDIFCDLTMSDRSAAALLIENKLDALEQFEQAESYREELAVLAVSHSARSMIIICPAGYADEHRQFVSKFDQIVTYEELADYFRSRETQDDAQSARYRFRRELLEQAIRKSRRGYEPIPNPVIGDFNKQYCALLAKLAPEIRPGPTMLKPANPDESVSMIYDAAASLSAIPADIRPRRFAHELGKGNERRANYVAVTFANWGPALALLRDMFIADTASLNAAFATKPPSKRTPQPGLVMSIATSAVDNQKDFDAQSETIASGIAKARQLRQWLVQNQPVLRKWQSAVRQEMTR